MIKRFIKKNKNYKLVIGLILGVILSATGVYAATTYIGTGSNISYNRTLLSNNWLVSTNVQDALDELYRQKMKKCPVGKVCFDRSSYTLSSDLSPGDYISYIPPTTSYTTSTTYTGYTSTQTINPSELNVWRVLRINDNGTVDIISENVSSTNVYFRGKDGYRNLVYYLNVLASQYENSIYTVGSRHFGYNGQTEIIPDTHFTNPAPWTCSTGGSCNPVESLGGGDTLYQTDYDLVNTVLGTRVGKKPGSSSGSLYWMASRYYYYSSSTDYRWNSRYVMPTGSLGSSNYLYHYDSSSFIINYISNALRPIVTLKSELVYVGSGTSSDPYTIVG